MPKKTQGNNRLMTTSKPLQTFLTKLYKSSGWALFTMFTWELVEEGLENLIAYLISSAFVIFIAKILSTLAIVISTQGIKVVAKTYLFPFFKKIIYKEGNDKVEKIKNFFKLLWANKKTLTGIASASVATLSGTGVIDISTLPELVIDGFNITPILYYGALLVLALIGITGKGFETIKQFFDRKAIEKTQAEQKAILKEAKKEIANEQKVANQTQAQQEKAEAKKLAEEQAKKEKEKADAEHRAKVEQAKAQLIADAQKSK